MAYRPSRRMVVFAAIVVAVVGAFTLLLPEIVRRAAISRLEKTLTVPVAIEDVDINLFTGNAAVTSLVIGAPPQAIATVPLITLGFSRSALLTGAIDLQRVSLHDPALLVERTAPGEYNLAHAIRPAGDKDDPGTGVDFAVSRVEVHNGEVEFIDRTREPDYRTSFTSLDIAAGPISTLPVSRSEPTHFTAGLQIAGGSVRIAGTSKPLAKPLDLELTAEVENVELDRFGVYLPYGARLNLRNTTIGGRVLYVLGQGEAATAQHVLEGSLKISGFGLGMTEQDRHVIQVAAVEAQQIHIDLLENRARIGALLLSEPYMLVERDASGFNFGQFLPGAGDGDSKTSDATGEAMSWVIQRAETKGGRLEFVDRTVNPGVNVTLHDLGAVAEGMTVWPSFRADNLTAEARSDRGSLRTQGRVQNNPLNGEFTVAGNQLPFTPFRGYLDQLFTTARTRGDLVNGDLKLTFAPAENGEIATSISGRLDGHRMALHFPEEESAFLTTRQLGVDVSAIRFGAEPRVEIEEINFRGAHLDFLRDRAGNINLRRLWSADRPEPEEEKAPAADGQAGTKTVIHSITVQEGVIAVADRAVSPNYTSKITRVVGKITGLLPATKRAEISFEGILGERAKIQLSGWATPFTEKPYMHLEGAVRSYALPPLNPYATEYVSHRVRQGEITTEISYTMEGDDMHAKAEIALRDVRLGEKTGDEFEKRVGIPLELALALLQDLQGVVRLQLEMSGGSGPKFDVNIATVIWNAVSNAVVSAVTAPFRLVGNILTLGGRIGSVRINPVQFEPGTRQIQPESLEQVAELARLLRERPRLEVRLNGHASRDEAAGMKERIFWQKIDATGTRDYQDALVRVYRNMTGTEIKPPLRPSVEESMEEFILARIEISDTELQQLARDRADVVAQELARLGIDGERLLLAAGEVISEGKPAVQFTLVS